MKDIEYRAKLVKVWGGWIWEVRDIEGKVQAQLKIPVKSKQEALSHLSDWKRMTGAKVFVF